MEDIEEDERGRIRRVADTVDSFDAYQTGTKYDDDDEEDEDDDAKHPDSPRDSSYLSSSTPRSEHLIEELGRSCNGLRDFSREEDNSDYEDDRRTSHSTGRPGSKRLNARSDCSQHTEHKMQRKLTSTRHPAAGLTDDEAGETLNETSYEETTFNTSLCSDRGTGSSSELSIDPVVWKKFKFLSSILKVM